MNGSLVVPRSRMAQLQGMSRRTASKSWNRYLESGEAGLVDRRSVPRSCTNRLNKRTERRIIGLPVNRWWGPAHIAGHLHLGRLDGVTGVETVRDITPTTSGSAVRSGDPFVRESDPRWTDRRWCQEARQDPAARDWREVFSVGARASDRCGSGTHHIVGECPG